MVFIEIAFLMSMFTSSGPKPPSTSSKSLSVRTFDLVSNIKIYLKQVHLHLFYFDISALYSCNFATLTFLPGSPGKILPILTTWAAAQTASLSRFLPPALTSLLHSPFTLPRLWALLLKDDIRTGKAGLLEPDSLLLTSSVTLGSSFRPVPPFPSYAVRMVITTSSFIGALWGWVRQHLRQT